jgi:hypothetical protein
VDLLYLMRAIGRPPPLIDKSYGHPVPDSDEHVRGLLDAYDGSAAKEELG